MSILAVFALSVFSLSTAGAATHKPAPVKKVAKSKSTVSKVPVKKITPATKKKKVVYKKTIRVKKNIPLKSDSMTTINSGVASAQKKAIQDSVKNAPATGQPSAAQTSPKKDYAPVTVITCTKGDVQLHLSDTTPCPSGFKKVG